MINFTSPNAPSFGKTFVVASSMVVLSVLSGCGKNDDGRTVGQKLDSAVSKTEQAARDAKANTETSMNNAGTATKDAIQKAEVTGAKSTQSMSASVDDIAITASVSAGLAKDAELSAIKIDVDTKGRIVTLNGPAPSAAARDRATTIAKGIKGVSSVDNKLVVKGS